MKFVEADRTYSRSKQASTMGLMLAGLVAAGAASAQDWDVDWSTIDGGGVIESETADQQWQLSGTIGQWDSQSNPSPSGGGFQLTGGFWSLLFDPSDGLFRDRFEWVSPPVSTNGSDSEENP